MFSKLLLAGGFLVALSGAACSDAATSRATPRGDEGAAQTAQADEADEADGDFEVAKLRAHRTPPRLQRFDANHDGVLQATEVPARLRAWFTNVDANKDNVVTADEIRAYNRAHPHAHHPHAHEPRRNGPTNDTAPPARASETTL